METIYSNPLHIELSGPKLFVDGRDHAPSVRKLSELGDVMLNDIEVEKHGDIIMYYMFRNIDGKNGLRYDITLIPGKKIMGECAKTYGHCHPIAEGKLTYPEIYQVLEGNAVFILQTESRSKGTDVSVIDAKKGDILLIPPNHCHVSINPGNEKLLLGNLVADDFESDYRIFKTNRGAAYYYMENGALVHNTNYFIGKMERIRPKEMNGRYGFSCTDILREFHSNPGKFEFLKKPSLL
ncbi:glucose-6-phosphate isomerase [Candidatus Micrarchaeota archaeon]|nr:glucose-6-phosphate isomerase [Candidatus Micrarchaeota archaeon]